MNNMKYYNESLAYDFEMFAPKTAKKAENRDNIVVMPSSKKRAAGSRSASKRMSSAALAIVAGIIVVAGFCTNIALKVQINEVNSQINEVKSQISELDSEKTELQVEMQRRISFANLELEAMQLGMQKPDKDSVVYIRVNDKNVARTQDGKLVESE